MELKVLGSNSGGNCYILENENEALIIEAGVKFAEVKVALDFNISKIVALLVSHEHGDHAGYINEYILAGIPVLASKGTFEARGINIRNAHAITAEKTAIIGRFRIMPFNVKHDCKEPFGFLITHPETGTILFATDTADIEIGFGGLNNILLEANYSKDIMYDNILHGRLNATHQARVEQSHMSIETCLEVLAENDLSEVNNIVLIHLSDGNANAVEFQNKVERATGKTVYVATKGLTIPFNKTAF